MDVYGGIAPLLHKQVVFLGGLERRLDTVQCINHFFSTLSSKGVKF